MKIRYVVIVYTIAILIIMGMFYNICTKEDNVFRDMVYYNEQIIKIQNDIYKGIDRENIEHDYDCNIILMKDNDYELEINKSIQRGDILIDLYENNNITGKVTWKSEWELLNKIKKQILYKSEKITFIILIVGYIILGIVYFYFIRPFQKLQKFSSEIAKGNLDFPLFMEKNNFFGAFTESFDIMREELKRAREGEYRANRSKKELVAELSHDIKTPLSTIKATCEVMELKEESLATLEKVRVIAVKSDMIEHLIDNMFHATMEELEVLKVEVTEESSTCIVQMIGELKYYGEIIFINDVPECLVYMDKLRLQQVIDNIVNNAYKYAGTSVEVCFSQDYEGIQIKLQDRGMGVEEEELALITEKFYRGSNTIGKSGSGLGLYLSKMFMEHMKGEMECYNDHGFVVVLYLKRV